LTHLGQNVLDRNSPIDWKRLERHDSIRELIGELIPGFERISDIGRSKKEFHIPDRSINSTKFPTPSGKAKFHAVAIPKLPAVGENEFRLMTIRSEGQFNTVVYEDEDLYRGQKRRDVILMNPADIARLGLQADQPVKIVSAVGEMRYQRVRPFDVRCGNVMMYCPESNVLIPRNVDPESKTPAFKNIPVTITAEPPAS